MTEISATDDNVKQILTGLASLGKKVDEDRGLYKKHYDNILKNCTLGEMLNWAKLNDKKGKLERVIENSEYYQNQPKYANESQEDISQFFNHILQKFGKMKYKQIGKGDTKNESSFLISLMTAVFDSILKKYRDLVQKNIDTKTIQKMTFGGIKGKDIEKYIRKNAGISTENLNTSNTDDKTMIGRLDVKRQRVDALKNAISIGKLKKLFEEHPGRTGTAKDNKTITKISADCINQIENINNTLKSVKDSLAKII